MNNTLEEAKAILKKYNQEHILKGYDRLDEKNKRILLEQILNVDYELINSLYANTKKLVVFCTPNFYRWDNVRLTCEKYNIELVQDTNPLILANKIISKL